MYKTDSNRIEEGMSESTRESIKQLISIKLKELASQLLMGFFGSSLQLTIQQVAAGAATLTPEQCIEFRQAVINTSISVNHKIASKLHHIIPTQIPITVQELRVMIFDIHMEFTFDKMLKGIIDAPQGEELTALYEQLNNVATNAESRTTSTTTTSSVASHFTRQLTPIQVLLQEYRTDDINVAFRRAAFRGHTTCVIFLLQQEGVNVHGTTSKGLDALALAREKGHDEVVKVIEAFLNPAEESASSLSM